MERKQFTFYASFFKAVSRIRNKADRADAYDMICNYALNQIEPDLDDVPDTVAIVFDLLRPVLDKARGKAEAGKKGGSKSEEEPECDEADSKQTESKPKANAPNHESKKEKEGEIEGEIEEEVEREVELDINNNTGDGDDSARATEEELGKIGLKPGEYLLVTKGQVQDTIHITNQIFGKYLWEYAARPVDYRQVFEILGGQENGVLLDYAFEQAALSGKERDWPYIRGIMNRLWSRNIRTVAQAREYDRERPDQDEEAREAWEERYGERKICAG